MSSSRQKKRSAFALLLPLLAFFGGFASCSLHLDPTNRYALVIGITEYQDYVDPDHKGRYCWGAANDAISMGRLLANSGWTVEPLLTNQYASKSNIASALDALASRLDSSSSVLVYFSGHGEGQTIGSNLPFQTSYLIPWDGVTAGGGLQQSNWIDPSLLSTWMAKFKSANKLLILDCCYSGGFVDPASSLDTAPGNYGPRDGGTEANPLSAVVSNAGSLLAKSFAANPDPSVLTLSAAGANEQSYGDAYYSVAYDDHGVFTWFLLQAAQDKAADQNSDGLVTVVEAYAYAKNRIKETWNLAQNNSYDIVGYDSTTIPSKPIKMYYDFLPHISGGSGDLVLYLRR